MGEEKTIQNGDGMHSFSSQKIYTIIQIYPIFFLCNIINHHHPIISLHKLYLIITSKFSPHSFIDSFIQLIDSFLYFFVEKYSSYQALAPSCCKMSSSDENSSAEQPMSLIEQLSKGIYLLNNDDPVVNAHTNTNANANAIAASAPVVPKKSTNDEIKTNPLDRINHPVSPNI